VQQEKVISQSATAAAPPQLAREAGAEEHRVSVDGIGIRYLRAGSGPPVLLIHGLMGFSFSWRKNMAALARVSTVYAPDLPGTGYSDRSTIDCSFAGIAGVMLRFMDALGINRATVVGTSHGGAVAMIMTAIDRGTGGHRIARLVLPDPVNPYSRAGRKRIAVFSSPVGSFLAVRSAPILKRMHNLFLERMYGNTSRITPGTAEGYAGPFDIPGTLHHVVRMLKSWRKDVRLLEQALPTIADVPTLLMWGRLDTAVPISSLEPLRKHFHDVRTVVFEDAGHLPYEEVPEEFNKVLIEFLCS
jgi:pimeloyl-ACP methyl ester carboxylesterase